MTRRKSGSQAIWVSNCRSQVVHAEGIWCVGQHTSTCETVFPLCFQEKTGSQDMARPFAHPKTDGRLSVSILRWMAETAAQPESTLHPKHKGILHKQCDEMPNSGPRNTPAGHELHHYMSPLSWAKFLARQLNTTQTHAPSIRQHWKVTCKCMNNPPSDPQQMARQAAIYTPESALP